jgi:hypothetical protein
MKPRKEREMSRFIHVFVIGAALVAPGCGGTPELPPAKDTKAIDPEQMKKNMEESMKRGMSPAAQERGAPTSIPAGQ